MDWNQTYRRAPGFGFRREGFGGILFHFEGRAPDPRLTFVESPFLIDLLGLVEQAPLEQVIQEARAAFALNPAQEEALRGFFRALVDKRGLVPDDPEPDLSHISLPAGGVNGRHLEQRIAPVGLTPVSPQARLAPLPFGYAQGRRRRGAGNGVPRDRRNPSPLGEGSARRAEGEAPKGIRPSCNPLRTTVSGTEPGGGGGSAPLAPPEPAHSPPSGQAVSRVVVEPAALPLQERLRGESLSAPITVTWEVTNRCNLRCVHCLSDSSPEADARGELNLAEAQAVIGQLVQARVFQVHFGGGEPFVYPGFLDLLRHARARGMHCLCVSSNGSLLDAGRIAALEALGGIYLQLSLDGASAATCDALRGPGTFRKVVAALERLRHSAIVRTVNLVYCRANAPELDAAEALCAKYGATLRVTRLKPSGRGAAAYAALRPTQGQLAALHGWLHAHPQVLTGDTFFHLNALGGAPFKGFRFCGAARLTCLITPAGDVYPCAFTQAPGFRAGNLREQPFHRIWRESPVFNSLFRSGAGTLAGGACGTCSAFGGCGGGCPAVKRALTGRLDVPDPDCVIETARGTARDAVGQAAPAGLAVAG